MASIEEILKRAKPRTKVVSICLDGELRGEHEALSAELERVQRESIGKMAGSAEARQVAERIQAVEADIAKAMQEFRFRGLSDFVLDQLMEEFPAREGKREAWNFAAASPKLVSLSAVEPAMTAEEASELRKSLAHADWDTLTSAAWDASAKKESVPFSVRASALISTSAPK